MSTLITILFLVVCILVVGLLLTLFTIPGIYARFFKSVTRSIKRALGMPTLTEAQEEAKVRAVKLAPYQNIVDKIEKIIPGEILRYKIPETWGGSFVAIQKNPQYPGSGRMYILSIEDGIQGMPGGQKTVMYDSDEPLVLASSVVDRSGQLFSASGEKSVKAERTTVNAG